LRFLPRAAGLLLALPALPHAQQFPPIRVQVRLVSVFVSVTDASGAPIGSLTKDDFAVADNGHPQKIAVFERQTQLPLSIALAIDTSGSVRKDLSVEKQDARQFVHTILRPTDRLCVIDFNTTVRQVVPFTNDPHKIDSGIDALSKGPATALYSAIQTASEDLAPYRGRKVLVLITDGGNTVSGVNYDEALEQALRGEVMIYSIIDLPVTSDAGRDVGGEHALITLSQETGGKYYYAEKGDLAAVFARLAEDLRTEYLIGYYPVKFPLSHSDLHTITVRLKTPEAATYKLTYRTAYYTGSSAQQDDNE
jgi:Ca-activated chloride channel family protein